MVSSMKRRDVERALRAHGCVKVSTRGGHDKWHCPCGEHVTMVPRHTTVTPGVVRSIERQMGCLPEGWLQ